METSKGGKNSAGLTRHTRGPYSEWAPADEYAQKLAMQTGKGPGSPIAVRVTRLDGPVWDVVWLTG